MTAPVKKFKAITAISDSSIKRISLRLSISAYRPGGINY